MMGGREKINIGGIEKSPEEVSAAILRTLKKAAEEQSGESFDEVVITHPAYFNDRQIFATQQAGLLAGFKNVYLLSEPLAAAIEYGYRQSYAQTLLVYDLGGGTFDACVLKVSLDTSGQEVFQELSDVGDMNLGGDDFDAELVRWLKFKFAEENNVDLDALDNAERKRVIQKLKQEAEQIKKKLSGTNKANVRINPLVIIEGVPKNLNAEITREEFEAMIRKYVDRSRDIIEDLWAVQRLYLWLNAWLRALLRNRTARPTPPRVWLWARQFTIIWCICLLPTLRLGRLRGKFSARKLPLTLRPVRRG
jgi:molecular chaperone DnaK